MTYPFRTTVTDPRLAEQLREQVELGHFFVFVKDRRALKRAGKAGRLFGYRATAGRSVIALADRPVELAGVVIRPERKALAPLTCLVADRDLYRTEQDTVRLFIAAPAVTEYLRIELSQHGTMLTSRAVELENGMGVETFSTLLAGRYQASLWGETQQLGPSIDFTVAEYALAPMSARLVTYQFLRAEQHLRFELAVSCYQRPLDDSLIVSLFESDRKLEQTLVKANAPGRYQGQIRLRGEGPFRLRLMPMSSAVTAEVTIPGSRRSEREHLVISELGRETQLSLLPEPQSIAVRGAHLTEHQDLGAPISVESVIAERGVLHARADLEALTLLVFDVISGRSETLELGNVARGEKIEVPLSASTSMVCVGCFIDGHPFEAFTSFFKPQKLSLAIDAPASVRPNREVELVLTCTLDQEPVPCLLAVREQRLTQRDSPEVALAAGLKRNLTQLVDIFDDGSAFVALDEVLVPPARTRNLQQQMTQNLRISRMQLFIVTSSGQLHRVDKDPFIIGRGRHSDLVIESPKISRQHASITMLDGNYHIEDLASSNGLWRGGEKVEQRRIQDGDEVIIGDHVLKMIFREGEVPAAGRNDFDDDDPTPVDGILESSRMSLAVEACRGRALVGLGDDDDDSRRRRASRPNCL